MILVSKDAPFHMEWCIFGYKTKENKMEINENIARKVLEVVDQGLVFGVGIPVPGRMCVEAAVGFALGLEHGDKPTCVAPSLRQFKIGLNDAFWSSPEARAKGLRRLALIQLGSKDNLDEIAFVQGLARLAQKWTKGTDSKEAKFAAKEANSKFDLLKTDLLCFHDTWPPLLRRAAIAARVVRHVWIARERKLARHMSDSNSREDILNQFLSDCAEDVVQLLIELRVPGRKWLYLTE
jgi:hypothetical protein